MRFFVFFSLCRKMAMGRGIETGQPMLLEFSKGDLVAWEVAGART